MSTFKNASLKSKGDTLRIYPFLNYSQNFMVTQKSPKTKVVPNSKFYNFALTTILKLCLHFKMQV